MSIRRTHGLRNEALCDKLHGDKSFYDWVVTTAFYSALHYVEHKLFHPPSTPHRSLGDAKRHYAVSSFHKARQYLIQDYFQDIETQYVFLTKESHTSRYIDYNTRPATAEQARTKLAFIKGKCGC